MSKLLPSIEDHLAHPAGPTPTPAPEPPARAETRAEVVERLMHRNLEPITDLDLDTEVREQLGFDSEEAGELFVIDRQTLTRLAHQCVAEIAREERRRDTYRSCMDIYLEQHHHCAEIFAGLLANRNDLLAGLADVRNLCLYDAWEGQYGDRLVHVHAVRDLLRPDDARLRDKPECDCNECSKEGPSAIHDDDCPAQDDEAQREAKLQLMISLHADCGTTAQYLHDEIDQLRLRTEEILALITTRPYDAHYYGEGAVIRVEDLLGAVSAVEYDFDETEAGDPIAEEATDLSSTLTS
jgi:hypothetical protein